MLVLNVAPVGIERDRQPAIAFALFVEQLAHAMQPSAGAGTDQCFMKLAMRLIPGVADARFEVGWGLLQPFHSVRSAHDTRLPFDVTVIHGLFQAERFDLDAGAREVDQFVGADGADPKTPVRLVGDHALGAQARQGFANGPQADFQPAFQCLDVELFAGLQAAVEYLGPDEVSCGFGLGPSAGKTSAIVMFLVAAAQVSAWLIAAANIPMTVSGLLEPLLDRPVLLMLVIMLLVFVVGTVLDFAPTILILIPVLMPTIRMAGIDPVYFGVLFIMNNAIGLITPPVGTVLNVVSGVARVRLDPVIRAITPYLLVQTAVLVLLVLFPQLVLAPLQFLTR